MAWAAWEEWVEWECNPISNNKEFKGHLLMAFFFGNIKIIQCQKDTAGNRSRTQVLIKNQN